MSSLTKLQALKCYSYSYWIIEIPIKRFFFFPTTLKRLTLAGEFCFHWKYISTLVMLPNHEELKLKGHAVVGQAWRLSDEEQFQSLKQLLSNELDFRMWEASSDSFPNLKRLALKNCRYLKEISTDFAEICTLESIELHDCSSPAEHSARKIKNEQEEMGNNSVNVYIHRTRKIEFY
ncbi:putative late blight resistance protein homolog R1A-3 isoform X1 [Lycium ferocissimum]|uniref:putative late blight resistance protein homolog R1A-3 isoform X1 n=1 Tax=Lycium ferocissimum TaxID=112874 RepID=UPI0028158555|nr:putative late blight resistance protein homolog R1A-3 isoform X1 [Lycium ferocissimum]